jgi:hypothetical protein
MQMIAPEEAMVEQHGFYSFGDKPVEWQQIPVHSERATAIRCPVSQGVVFETCDRDTVYAHIRKVGQQLKHMTLSCEDYQAAREHNMNLTSWSFDLSAKDRKYYREDLAQRLDREDVKELKQHYELHVKWEADEGLACLCEWYQLGSVSASSTSSSALCHSSEVASASHPKSSKPITKFGHLWEPIGKAAIVPENAPTTTGTNPPASTPESVAELEQPKLEQPKLVPDLELGPQPELEPGLDTGLAAIFSKQPESPPYLAPTPKRRVRKSSDKNEPLLGSCASSDSASVSARPVSMASASTDVEAPKVTTAAGLSEAIGVLEAPTVPVRSPFSTINQ